MNDKDSSAGDGEIFDLCSKPTCPRDIRFHCEALINFQRSEAAAAAPKNKKHVLKDELYRSVTALLSAHYVERNATDDPYMFCCSMCRHTLKGIKACLKHIIVEGVHGRNETAARLKFTRENLPDPSEEHCISLEGCLLLAIEERGISKEEMTKREELVRKLNEELEEKRIYCKLVLYGSSVTTLGFAYSDINATIIVVNPHEWDSESEARHPFPSPQEHLAHCQVVTFFQNHPRVVNVSACPISRQLIIQLRESEAEGSPVIALGLTKDNTSGLEISKLLRAYVKRCSLLRPLVLALRLWAKYVQVDDVRKEGLPPFAWATLAVYFLQQNGFLPILNPLALEGPEDFKGNQVDPSRPGLLGRLWFELLRFYSSEILHERLISMSGNVTQLDPNVKDRKICVEDPFNKTPGKKSRIQTSPQIYDYISKMFAWTFLYYGAPRTRHGPLYEAILPGHRQDICSPNIFHRVSTGQDPLGLTALEEIDDPRWDPVNLAVEVKGEKEGKEWLLSNPALKIESVRVRLFRDHSGRVNVLEQDVTLLGQLFPDWLYEYKFERGVLQGKSKPPVFCKTCSSKEHYMSDCPLDKVEEVDTNTRGKVNNNYPDLSVIQEVLQKNYESEGLTKDCFAVRQEILNKLKQPLLEFYPKSSLELFGSSVNGFGAYYSDIDMCLLLDEEERNRNKALAVMSKVQKTLYRLREFQVVYFVRHARIPIVKFRHIPSNLDGDVSSSNALAVKNSQMLRTYAEIDPRVKIIGLFWKRILKACDVSCASKSGLSSYGFTLLLIHYFQQVDPPVLPVLQELQRRQSRGPLMLEGWDVQFYSDLQNLKFVWEGYGQNRSSLAELWLGLLKYYSETFDFEKSVISIRQSEPIEKISKFWIPNSLICIEDPFQLSHNVGGSLSRKSSIRILNTIRKLRGIFSSQFEATVLETYKDWLSYFTDPKVVKYQEGGKRKCPVCSRPFGHKQDCPERRKKLKIDLEAILPPPEDPPPFHEDIVL